MIRLHAPTRVKAVAVLATVWIALGLIACSPSVTRMEATEVKKGAISADAFATPAGYKLVESPIKKMGKAGK